MIMRTRQSLLSSLDSTGANFIFSQNKRWGMNHSISVSAATVILAVLVMAVFPVSAHATEISHGLNWNKNKQGPALQGEGMIQSGGTISPYLYTGEPAPMGIASYGIGPGNSAFIMNSTSYVGIINISSIQTYNSSWPGSAMTFQLNLNLVFSYGGQEYVYWVQDVAYLNTSDKQIAFLDNVWNSSSANAQILNSTISGNGTVASDGGTGYYYDEPGNIPGNLATLTYPSQIILRINASASSSGNPEVIFSYNDGSGWVIFDNVIFPFASLKDGSAFFMVDGYQYKPDGIPMDAELILGGPGGGSDTWDNKSLLSLMLQYWNGNNYQSVFDAFNFGSNTAEGISNTTVVPLDSSSPGIPGSEVTSGPGTLSMLYNTSEVGFITIDSPGFGSGSINIGKTSIFYTGGMANITLSSGIYNLTLTSGGTRFNFHNITVLPGHDTELSTEKFFRINVAETGLPSGEAWSLLVNGTIYRSTLDNISISEANGTYNISVSSVPGYRSLQSFYNITVDGMNLNITVVFSPVRYLVTFILDQGQNIPMWNISLGSEGIFGTSSGSLSIYLPNGTYLFVASTEDQRYENYSGSFNVSSSAEYINVVFPVNAIIDIHSSLAGSSAIINGNEYSFSGNLSIYVAPGNCSIFVTSNISLPFFSSYDLSEGQVLNISVNLSALPSSGILEGTINAKNASLFANGIPVPVVGGIFRQPLPPGDYLISASAPGHEGTLISFQISNDTSSHVDINLSSAKTLAVRGSLYPAYASVMFDGQPAVQSLSGRYLTNLAQGRYTVSVTAAGFVPYTTVINITRNMSENFTLLPLPSLNSTFNDAGVSVLTSSGNITSMKFNGSELELNFTSPEGGYLLISVPYSHMENTTLEEVLSSRVFVNGIQTSNYTVALTNNYTVTLYIHLSGDPEIIWILNSSLPAPPLSPGKGNSNHMVLEYALLAVMVIILAMSIIFVRRR